MTEATDTRNDVLEHFRRHSTNTNPGTFAPSYNALPTDLASTCRAVQSWLVHMFWIDEAPYGVTHAQIKASGRRMCEEFALSTAEERLASIFALDDRSLAEPRPADRRSVGCCRDYALMLTSVLRHRGIPARVRTGVALYFVAPDGPMIEDHYVTEHWNTAEERWQLTDPQIDELQRSAVDSELDVLDFSEDLFLTGARLVEAIRDGRVPTTVGFPPVNVGATYGRNKLFADFASLTGYELPVHAWWGLGDPSSVEPGDDALVDRLIELAHAIDRNDVAALGEALHLSRTHPRLRMPAGYTAPPYKHPLC